MRSLAAVALAVLSSCGYVGPPQPPALNLPRTIEDLRVSETGDQIVVEFTPPDRTTEDLPVVQLRSIELLAGPAETDFALERWTATARRYQVPTDAPGRFTIPARDFSGQQLVLAVRATGRTGRTSDWSNFAYLSVAPPLAQPVATATNAAEGVALAWTGDAPRYRILRAVGDGEFAAAAETEMPSFLDESTIYGTRYRYVVVGLAGDAQQSLPSASVEITPVDVFPPSAPAGLAPIPGVGSIDLSWTRSSEEDLASYTVFRAEGDAPLEPYARDLTIPAFTDMRVESGKRYRYAISATDTAGNESPRSAEVSAQVE